MSFLKKNFRLKTPFDTKNRHCKDCWYYDSCKFEAITPDQSCCNEYTPDYELLIDYDDRFSVPGKRFFTIGEEVSLILNK